MHTFLRSALFAATLLSSCGGTVSEMVSSFTPGSASLSFEWPPTAGERYPDLDLRDSNGEYVQLSSFEGKVLLIEPIGMT